MSWRAWVCTLMSVVAVGCGRTNSPPVVIEPEAMGMLPNVPTDPFGTSSPAYERLVELTDAARTTDWDGQAESLAGWLEAQTIAVEQSLALMKALRVGPSDAYAVANGRIALLYEHIAGTLTQAEAVVADDPTEYDWLGQEFALWERANGFWARCARGCSLEGPYLDVWELRCEAGERETKSKVSEGIPVPSARQPK
ncbi:MAG: hypothetical protein AAF500_09030 [Myxococcota bacterium]